MLDTVPDRRGSVNVGIYSTLYQIEGALLMLVYTVPDRRGSVNVGIYSTLYQIGGALLMLVYTVHCTR